MRKINLLCVMLSCFMNLQSFAKYQEQGAIPAPLPDLDGIKNFVNQHKGNLPDVFGSQEFKRLSLKDAYLSKNFKTFPIKLGCNFDAGCSAKMRIGQIEKGVFRISATDKNTQNSFGIIVKLYDKDMNPIDFSQMNYSYEQNGSDEVMGESNMVDVSPIMNFANSAPISYFSFPLSEKISYQVCKLDMSDCTETKQLFDEDFSNNFIRYVSFWKLHFKSYLAPATSNSINMSYLTGMTKSETTSMSFSIGEYGLYSLDGLNASYTHSTSYTTSFQNSKTESYIVSFDNQKENSVVGEYVLYAGIIDDFPSIDPFIDALNSKVNNSEFKFSRMVRYQDSNPKSGIVDISTGSTAFQNSSKQNNNDGTDIVRWTVSVPVK